jgi:MerR family transcriptional regulator, copper efflux regulator
VAETEIACSLDPADQESRFAEFADLAEVALLEAVRTPRGAHLLLRNGDAVQASLGRLIEAERRCCSFLEFTVVSSGDCMRVNVSGPPEAAPLIERLLDLELAPGAAR